LQASRLKADLLLAFISFIWGSTFVVVKAALADASPLVFLALRFALATAVLLLVVGRRSRELEGGLARAGLLAGGFLATGYVFQTVGLQYTTPTKSAFITGLSVVLVPVLLALTFRRAVRHTTTAGVLAATVGLYLLTIPAGTFSINRGDLLTVFGALAFAAQIIVVGHYAGRFSFSALGLAQVAAALLLTVLILPGAHWTAVEPARLVWSPWLVLALAITGIFATALAFSIQAWAQRYTSPTHTALLFSLEPVFAALTSYLVYGERLTGRGLTGAALILLGILVVEFRGPAPTPAELPAPQPSTRNPTDG
jgi:drug/metabolite transporter (DMT)-like permease